MVTCRTYERNLIVCSIDAFVPAYYEYDATVVYVEVSTQGRGGAIFRGAAAVRFRYGVVGRICRSFAVGDERDDPSGCYAVWICRLEGSIVL